MSRGVRLDIRKGESHKFILANAGSLATDSPDDHVSVFEPWRPHLDLSKAELDELLPPLEAPEEEALDDIPEEEAAASDRCLQACLRLARPIETETHQHGRRRRPSASPTSAIPMAASRPTAGAALSAGSLVAALRRSDEQPRVSSARTSIRHEHPADRRSTYRYVHHHVSVR